MDFRSLQLFVHLAGTLHFGKSAEACHVSPPTLSRTIQRLEDEIGATLFIRDNRSVRLTAVGERVRKFAEQSLADWQSLKADVADRQQLLKGELALYCSVTASYSVLPPILEQFRFLHPNVEIQLSTGDAAAANRHVQMDEADLAITVKQLHWPDDLIFKPLGRVPLSLIAPRNADLRDVSVIDWQTQPVIMPKTGAAKQVAEHWFKEQHIKPNVYATVRGHEAIVSMIALGYGVGIVPEVVVENSMGREKVDFVLGGKSIGYFELGICCRRRRAHEPAISAFLAL